MRPSIATHPCLVAETQLKRVRVDSPTLLTVVDVAGLQPVKLSLCREPNLEIVQSWH